MQKDQFSIHFGNSLPRAAPSPATVFDKIIVVIILLIIIALIIFVVFWGTPSDTNPQTQPTKQVKR